MINTIKINEKEFEMRPNTRRKRISVGIDSTGIYYIAYPSQFTHKMLNNALKNETHMNKIIPRIEKNFLQTEKHSYKEGETFLFSGFPYTLKYKKDDSIHPLELIGNSFFLSKNAIPLAYDLFEKWYARSLYAELNKILPYWTKTIEVQPLRINVKNVKTMWGSCSCKNNITFSTRLALVPPELLEYVVVHELCHLKEMNHSQEFWAKVAEYLPDYKIRRNTLKKNASLYRW